ncbi:LacI family DNA-binding transcriptional regulator [Cellulosimicrobium terreum]|nr:LacI family DNA-binding transcriptional regulator [Cellulosimicrobium terreum]
MHDVAARAGVSKSLVSLALRGDPGVGDRTRERIRLIADDLGYRSNTLARGLVQGRTMLLGVVISSLENPYHTEIVEGVEEAAAGQGLAVLLVHGSRNRSRLAQHLDTLLGLNVDGLVVISSWLDEDQLATAARRAPVVMVGRSSAPVQGIDSVNNDDETGADLAVSHLVARGSARIVHVTSGTRPAALARRSGYEAAMSRHGLAGSIRVVSRDDGPLEAALDRALADGYDAVFARNDVEAFDVLDHGLDRGLRVPGELAVVGYDDSALARRTRPRLTSVNQPRQEMGARAVALLAERIAGRTTDRHEVLRPTLTVRGSSADGRA